MSMEIEATKSTKKPIQHVSTRKKRGPLHLLRVALYMIRRRSNGKSNSVHVDVGSKGLWKKLVCAMRPLDQHLEHSHSPPPSINADGPKVELLDDVMASPMSSRLSSSPSSRYASALNLQELDRSEGCDCSTVVIEEGYYDSNGDEMIDARAEEFIAHFYEQMRLQRLDSMDRYNLQMIEKGSD